MRGLFQASFDGALRPQQLRKARLAAAVVLAGVVALCIGGWFGMLHSGSGHLNAMVNSPAPGGVRVLGGETTAGKPCEDQTWPYIEARCLTLAQPQTDQTRTTPRHSLSGKVEIPPSRAQGAPAASAARQPGEAAAREATAVAEHASDREAAGIPLPPERPANIAKLAEPAAQASAESDPRPDRPEPARAQAADAGERTADDRPSVRKSRSAKRAERGNRRDRVVRRWTEYTFETPSGRSRRVIVIRRGSLDDDFFRTIR